MVSPPICGFLVVLATTAARGTAWAQTVPGEEPGGWLFGLTHLHPALYFVLAIIAVLSLLNLVVQGWISLGRWPFSLVSDLLSLRGGGNSEAVLRGIRPPNFRGASIRKGQVGDGGQATARPPVEEGVLAVRRVEGTADRMGSSRVPTPLEGLNHPLPDLTRPPLSGTGVPRIVESKPESPPTAPAFKFSSAVDLPSHKEMERREKSQLLVAGTVRDADGRGLGSVVVFLTDHQGNRVGQSCRSAADTGEFKVITNEPGSYILTGYRRGYAMEGVEPLVLPIETGKIEGYQLRMVAEGCIVRGTILSGHTSPEMAGLTVRCLCRRDEYCGSVQPETGGEFVFFGVPIDSECHLEVLGREDEILARSDPFQTVQKKEIYKEITLTSAKSQAPLAAEDSSAAETPLARMIDAEERQDSPEPERFPTQSPPQA